MVVEQLERGQLVNDEVPKRVLGTYRVAVEREDGEVPHTLETEHLPPVPDQVTVQQKDSQ